MTDGNAILRALLGCALVWGMGCGGNQRDSSASDGGLAGDGGLHHYFDINGTPLPQWDFVWDQLQAYFGSNTPDRITVEYKDGGTSQFFPADESIRITSGGDNNVSTVAHESTHLCNYNITQGASNTNSFRFFDEGFARIMGFGIASEADWYRSYALAIAALENQAGKVSFAQVQDWNTYFKNGAPASSSSTWNWNAYLVGSSFDYMIEDTYGADAFHSFLVDIGNTRDLGATFQNLFTTTTGAFEQDWLNYLSQVQIDESTPAVVELSPPDQAKDVPLDTPEISITFSVAMGASSCIATPCADTGVCYTNAYWKAHNVRAIKVDGGLKPGYTYHLTLGDTPSNCHFVSYVGVPLPITNWQFTAASE